LPLFPVPALYPEGVSNRPKRSVRVFRLFRLTGQVVVHPISSRIMLQVWTVGMSRTELPLMDAGLVPTDKSVDVAALHAVLTQTVAGEVRFDRTSRALYSTDASVYQIVPIGVVLPREEADVAAVVRACARFRVPLTARGGGTSQAGQAIGPGLALDCSKYFGRILEVNPGQAWVRVQPGCVLDELNQQVKEFGLHFAPDISTSNRATIGGMIANNAAGTHSLIHGKTIDHVLELKVLLADGSTLAMRALSAEEVEARCQQPDREGECYRLVRRLAETHGEEIERRYPKILRRVGGYNLDRFVPNVWRAGSVSDRSTTVAHAPGSPGRFNLAQLIVGSEGTLGIILEAKLRLLPLPRARALLVIEFVDLLDALAATPSILDHSPSAVEVIDRYILDSTRLNPEASRLRDFLQGDPGAILIVEFYGDQPEDLPARLRGLETDLRRRGLGTHFRGLTDPAAQARIWKLRKAALGLSMAEKGDAKAISFVEDTAVAAEHLRDYIAEFLTIIRRHGTRAGVYAHASVGCLHVRPVIDLKTETGVQRFETIAREVAELVLRYGGALSGEHGDGLVRSPFQQKMFGPVLYEAFREIKQTFDPLNLLNPGKIVDAPPLTANLRFGPAYVAPEVPTTFDFTADGGLTRAAELCAGVGECRKKREGTMCPSYQATGEEQHSTRGRANALRLAITGQVGGRGFTDPALREMLDLCLECKACKSECPTNVDMARLKAEYLHQYYQEHGLPLRNWVFGHVARLSRWGCRLAPVSSWLARSRLVRWLNDRLLGIDRRRRPPPFARRTFARQYAALRADAIPGSFVKSVLFFPDTFTNFHEPDIGLAAVQLLRALNCLVVPGFAEDIGGTGVRCCGRPFISNGMLTKAVECARHNVAQLYPWANTGTPIMACEPSCLLTIKDDYPALLRGDLRRQAETVSAACLTFEEFVETLLAANAQARLRLSFQPTRRTILVQAHCHARSLVGMGPTLRLLRRMPGAEIIDLDAGCCGMAGAFGYEKEHYEVSRLVGEQRLFPALRQASEDAVVVASGFSCRLQIQHFTGRTALHPAQVLRVKDQPNSIF
jgi:FAD/FMN-containing dehydrogenase/Fe-S oxidoreductase